MTSQQTFRDNDLLINYHDAVIYGWELKLIERRTEWLNDSCIHFYFTHLQQQSNPKKTPRKSALFMEPSVVSFWMHQCIDPDEIDDFCKSTSFPGKGNEPDGTIFVAVNDKMSKNSLPSFAGGGNHWSLLMIQVQGGRKRKSDASSTRNLLQCWHFDSVRNSGNLRAAQDIAEKLSRHVYPDATNSRGIVCQAQTPQQVNGYDCGVHVLGAAKILSKHVSMNETDDSPCESSTTELEEHLKGELGTDPQEFCSKLRREISSEIRRLHKETQVNKE